MIQSRDPAIMVIQCLTAYTIDGGRLLYNYHIYIANCHGIHYTKPYGTKHFLITLKIDSIFIDYMFAPPYGHHIDYMFAVISTSSKAPQPLAICLSFTKHDQPN